MQTKVFFISTRSGFKVLGVEGHLDNLGKALEIHPLVVVLANLVFSW